MEGEERPQKMRKLSRDHEESQAENVATKNESNAPENDNTAQSMTEENTATQENANAEIAPAPAVQSPATVATDGQNPPLSKNQLKKLRKKQEWGAGREERKVIRKEKVVAQEQDVTFDREHNLRIRVMADLPRHVSVASTNTSST